MECLFQTGMTFIVHYTNLFYCLLSHCFELSVENPAEFIRQKLACAHVLHVFVDSNNAHYQAAN